MRVWVIVNILLHRQVQHLGASRSARTMLPRACTQSSSCQRHARRSRRRLASCLGRHGLLLCLRLFPRPPFARAGLACETFEFFNLAMCMWGAAARHEAFSPRECKITASDQCIRSFQRHLLDSPALLRRDLRGSLIVIATDATAAMPTFYSSIFKLSIVSSLIVPSATSSPSSSTL